MYVTPRTNVDVLAQGYRPADDSAWLYLHENGKPLEEGSYSVGLREGTWRAYWEDGTLREEGRYAAGVRVGSWRRFNRDGEELGPEGGADLDGDTGEGS